MNPRSILALVRGIIAEQDKGSDYDALYFGMQDVEIMLEDITSSRRSYGGKPKKKYDEWGNKMWESPKPKRKQKPSAWNKFVKANSKKKKFIYQSGANKGKLNLKKMGVAWRKTAAGKKKR